MKIDAITIEREYGSGGTKIGRLLSEKTGIPCYGQEILEEVSGENDISVDNIQRYEENSTGSFLYSLYTMAKAAAGNTDMLSAEGHVFIAEQKVIKDFAMRGTSIFLGHCASEALKDMDNVIKVYIRCSDEAAKRQRIQEDYGIPAENVENAIKRYDKKRSNYYYANTGKKWNNYSNYDIVLDSAVFGIDGCVELLAALFR